MGEMFIVNGAGGASGSSSKMVLNNNYPQDLTVMESASGKASLSVVLTEGDASLLTYQWYMDNNAIVGATSSIYSYPCTEVCNHIFYCMVSNGRTTIQTRSAQVKVITCLPAFTYGGNYEIKRESNRYNWYIRLFTSGALKFTDFGNTANKGLDIYLVGGGGSGGSRSSSGSDFGSGGSGGTNKTIKGYLGAALGSSYTATIGAGGASVTGSNNGNAGKTTSLFVYSAAGGSGGIAHGGGASGTSRSASPFGDTQYGTYGAAGAGGLTYTANGGANTAKGGGGAQGGTSGAGGSGIIVIRNAR